LRATFDDGNRSDLEIAAPILAKYGVMGAFFPCSGRLTRDGYLTADDIRNLFSLGFEIGSHGVDHVPWTKQDAAALHRELVGSKAEFEQILGASIHAAAIPFGAYNRRVLAALKAAGYAKVYNSDRGFGYPGKWITRRWTYNSSEIFDLEYFVAKSSSVSERILVEAKGMIKSLR
jgi:peptidoglycan/xylan/chitin deacetylase (PgdA/CDA1 family)